MLIASGTVLVLLTWGLVASCIMIVGLPLAVLTHSTSVSLRDVRRGLWWGLSIFAISAMLIANVMPLGGSSAASTFVGIVGVGVVGSWVLIRKRGWTASGRMDAGTFAVIVLAAVVTVYLAVAALGPVTNFDSGLYHLSAIGLAQELAAIPGLANLHSPFGYANASFPMAAALGVTPWGTESYRLLNGLIIVLVLVDLLIRWMDRRRKAGSYGLLMGSVVLAVPMVALSDYWVTSPSQDAAVFAVVVAVSAMVMQSVSDSYGRVAEIAGAMAGSIVLVLLRPTMAAFALAVFGVAIVLVFRSRVPSHRWLRAAVIVGIPAILGGLAQIARDYVLSGWLVYPLSLMSFDVPWRAPDPVYLRIATLGYHRDSDDLWQAAEGWGWVGPWLSRLPEQWEFWLVLLLTLGLVGALIAVVRLEASLRLRSMVLAMAPSAVMVVVWWLATPPSFRFAWGPIFTLFTVPLGWIVWRVVMGRPRCRRSTWAAWVAWMVVVPVVIVAVFSLMVRLDWDSMTSPREWRAGGSGSYVVSPATVPLTNRFELDTGVNVYVPSDGDACWAAPLPCTPELDGRINLLDPSRGLAGGLTLHLRE